MQSMIYQHQQVFFFVDCTDRTIYFEVYTIKISKDLKE